MRFIGMVGVASVAVVTACGSGDVGSEPHRSDPTPIAGADTLSPRYFDAGALRPGHRFLNLQVAQVDVRRVFDDSVWAGRVAFDGQITVTGEYRRHFDWPEPAERCFFVTAPSSIARVPEFAPDAWTGPGQQTWFCFINPELAAELLGDGERPVRATIVVDEYVSLREFSDVYDTARLMEVVAAQP